MSIDLDNFNEDDNSFDKKTDLERYGVWIKKAPKDLSNNETDVIDFDPLSVTSFDENTEFSQIIDADTFLADEPAPASHESDPFEMNMEIDIDSFMSDDTPAELPAGESGDTEIDIDSFLSDSGEVDINAFMSTAEHMDADDFLGEISQTKKKDDIIDEEPIELDLSFDDSFSNRTAADPVNDVESVHAEITDVLENLDDSVFGDFDDMFDNIVDESEEAVSAVTDDTEVKQETADSVSADFDDASEFDDLLNMIDSDENIQGASAPAARPVKKEIIDFNISVSTDDDNEAGENIQKTDSNYDEAEIEDISIFESGKELENFKHLDKPEESGYTKLLKPESASLENDEDLDLLIAQADDISITHSDTCNNDEVTLDDQETSMDDMTKALLDKIANEISSLRSEVSDLRDEFNELKKNVKPGFEHQIQTPQESELPEEINESSGFFNDDVEDETIALSGDELNNILNNADFTEEFFEDSEKPAADAADLESQEPQFDTNESSSLDEFSDNTIVIETDDVQEEIEKGLQDADNEFEVYTAPSGEIDINEDIIFEEEKLEEPTLEDLEVSMNNEVLDDIPEEISIPKVDDMIVEPSSEDLIDYNARPLVNEENNSVDPDFSAFTDSFEIQETDIPEDFVSFEEDSKIITVDEIAHSDAEEETEPVFSSQWGDDSEPYASEENVQTDDFSNISLEEDIFNDTDSLEKAEEPSFEPEIADEPASPETDIIEAEEDFVMPSDVEIEPEEEFAALADIEIEAEEEFAAPADIEIETEEEFAAPADIEIKAEEEFAAPAADETNEGTSSIPEDLRQEIKHVLSYMDQLLENLPEHKIVEFAQSEHFEVYKKLFRELGLS